MKPVPSPLLKRLGLLSDEDENSDKPVASGTEYVRARVKDVHYKKVLVNREGTTFEYKGLRVQNHFA